MKCPETPVFINKTSALTALVDELSQEEHIAVDTESNSLFAYQEQVCLIQLSARGGHDYIVDPLAIKDMSSIGRLFANPAIEVVFHAAEYDIMCLKRDYGFEFRNLFDTYIAARTLGWEKVGLSSLLEIHFGVQLDKRYQQADWRVRPLPAEQLCYAQLDTHYLLELRDHLHDELVERGYLEEAREYFDDLTQTLPAHKDFDPDGFWRIRMPKDLEGYKLAVLRELYMWRERIAEKRDVPPFKVLHNSALVSIARDIPRRFTDLRRIKGLSRRIVDRYGKAILRVVERGEQEPTPTRKSRPAAPDAAILARYDALHEWRKQKAFDRGVSSDIILSKGALWALAHKVPQTHADLARISEIGPYRREKYADEILQVLAEVE